MAVLGGGQSLMSEVPNRHDEHTRISSGNICGGLSSRNMCDEPTDLGLGCIKRGTGVPRTYETAPPSDPTVSIRVGLYGGPRGGAVSYKRGTPVHVHTYTYLIANQ